MFIEAKDDGGGGGDNWTTGAISRAPFHGLAYPKLTWGLPTLSLTTSSSWLPWGRVAKLAMPLIGLLMPIPGVMRTVCGSEFQTVLITGKHT